MTQRDELISDVVERERYLARRATREAIPRLESEYAIRGLACSTGLLQALADEDLRVLDRVLTARLNIEFETPEAAAQTESAWMMRMQTEIGRLVDSELEWVVDRVREASARMGFSGFASEFDSQVSAIRRDRVEFFSRELRINRNRRRAAAPQSWPIADLKPTNEEAAEVVDFAFRRRQFDADQKRVTELARELGTIVSFLVIDLDNFKPINDTQGHDAGDEALKGVAAILLGGVMGKGRFYRLGGDEFGALLWNSSADEARSVAERLRSEVEAAKLGIQSAPLTVSIGVSTYPHPSSSYGDLYKNADKAMYEVKSSGKNAVRLYGVDAALAATAGSPVALARPSGVPTPNPYGLTKAALHVGKWLLDRDSTGLGYELYDLAQLPDAEGMTPIAIEDAVRELAEYGMVEVRNYGHVEAGARHDLPFALGAVVDFDPEEDIRAVARAIRDSLGMNGPLLLAASGLPIVRLNRAVLHMKASGLADVVQTIGTAPFGFYEIRPTFRTRRLLSEKA